MTEPLMASAGRRPMLITMAGAAEMGARLGRVHADPAAARQRAEAFAARLDAGEIDLTLAGGVAVIAIGGPLTDMSMGDEWFWYGELAYQAIRAQLIAAAARADVRAVLLRINSPGGLVSGCAETAAQITRTAAVKPVWAWAEMACSAAYWLAAAAGRIVLSPTAAAGSIGVMMTHVDLSRALDAAGITVTDIYAGEFKDVGTPFRPLEDRDRAELRVEIDAIYREFCAAVGRHRAKAGLDEAAARATAARVRIGADAVALRLADAVDGFDATVAALAAKAAGPVIAPGATARSTAARRAAPPKRTIMVDRATAARAADAEDGEDDEDDDARKAPQAADDEEDDRKDDKQEARRAEHQRIAAILRSAEAQGRGAAALELALETDLAAAAARKVLARLPGGNPAALAAMDAAAAPRIGPDPSGQEAGATAGWDRAYERAGVRRKA